MKRKFVLATMTIFAIAVSMLTLIVINATESEDATDLELKMLHIIMRHGARTPASTYPTDPYVNESFYPVGWGHLTNIGKRDLYNTGKFLRTRYDKFLGEIYEPGDFYSQSTDVDRTKASLQLVNAGLWPPKKAQKWGPLDWQPIPIHSEPLDQDQLLLVRRSCPQYNLEREKLRKLPEISAKFKQDEDLFAFLTEMTGLNISDYDDVQDVYSTLVAEETCNLTLPTWTKSVYPTKLFLATSFSYVYNSYNSRMIRLKGGVLLKKILTDWSEKITRNDTKKIPRAFLYGGHDSTIVNLLRALKVWQTPQVPGYGITILLELLVNKASGEYGIQIFERIGQSEPKILTVPGCQPFCHIDKLKKLIEDSIPDDWDQECVADDPSYIPPPPGAP